MGDPSVGMMKVTKKWWWRTSRLASSASGMRWPIPGLGTMATWGCFCWVCSMVVGLGVQGEGKQYVFTKDINIVGEARFVRFEKAYH